MKTKAVIICDMWDNHHCISSDRRIGELAPKINNFISVCRSDNIKIIHGVSMCMEYYKDTKARQNVFNLPDVEVPNILWNKFSDILSTMLPTRISPNIRGQVTTCSCDTHKDTPCCGMEVYDPEVWQPIKQRDEIQIKSEDFIIDDNIQEIYNILAYYNIKEVIMVGVHLNGCIMDRNFGIIRLKALGIEPIVCEDLIDTHHQYEDEEIPLEELHEVGNNVTIDWIDDIWCPVVKSEEIINGQVERKDIYTDGIRTRPAGIDYEDYLVPGEDEVHHKEYGPNHNPKNGKFRKHWSNGNLRYEWEYKNGKRVDGISRGWWPNGQLKQEWTWKDGRVNGLQTHYWMSGKKSCEGSYKEIPDKLVRVGKWTWWYEKETGEQKYREINYKNDPIETRHGLVTLWYDNGQKKVEGNYKDGKEDGIWIAWDENGQIKRENKNYDDKLFSLNAGYNKIPEEFLLEPLKKYKKRKKKIIFNGCSLTYGAESVHDGIDQHLDNFNNSYPMLIQKKLKNIEVINLASCGKSNSQMFCQNIDYLMESISNEDELIFITQWSWVERFPKVVSVKNINKFEKTAEWLSFLKYYSDQEHGISTIADYDGRHDTWVDADLNMEEHNVQYNLLANMSLTMLLSYINLLDTYNVKNLNYITQLLTTDEMKVSNRFQEGNNDFTSTYDLNCITEEILKHKNFLMDDWITEFICKPEFLRKNSHASAEGHQLWAEKLLKILIDKKYISRTDIR